MWLYEFDEEGYRQDLYEEGMQQGLEKGIEKGMNRTFDLLQTLTDAGRTEDVQRAIADPEYRQKLCAEYFSR